MHAITRKFSRIVASKRRSLLAGVAVLAPLVLLLGVYWKQTQYRAADFAVTVTQDELFQTAQAFLEAKGAHAGQQRPRLRIDHSSEYFTWLHRLAQSQDSAVRASELPVAPAVFVVEYGEPDRAGQKVVVAPDGRVVGFALRPPSRGLFIPEDARELALAQARSRLLEVLRSPDRYQLSDPRVYEQTGEAGDPQFRVEWTAAHRLVSGVSFQMRFGIAGEQVYSQELVAVVDPSAVAHFGMAYSLREALVAIAPFYFLALVVYMLTRYLQRSLEKEVSHGRAMVVGGYLVAMMAAIFATGDDRLLLDIRAEPAGSLFVLLFGLVMLTTLALFAGACYAACEGDVREHFPGSLTSFDALLTGRFLSRNVGRAFLSGFAAACWLFAFQVFVNLRLEGGMGEPGSVLAVYQLTVSAAPLLYVFLLLPVGVGIVMLFGYLAPLSLLARLHRMRWLAWMLLAAMSFTNLTVLHGGYTSVMGLFLTIGAEAALLIWLIVAVDMLTAYVCLVLGSYLTLLTDAQLLTSMAGGSYWLIHGVVALTVAAALALLKWGPELTDYQVRPAYARALAERQILSQQISTAALAQKQLMAWELPTIDGFSLAADCTPARAVSGDYFDCYSLGRQKLGVLVISGAGRGLLDAMVIAYAKGFLLEHADKSHSAQETLAHLMQALTCVVESADRFPELCYLVLDGEQRTAAYSRTPGFPELVRIRERDALLPSVTAGGGAEAAVTRILRGGRSITLIHGVTAMDQNMTLLAYSCGFASSLHLSGVLDLREWLRQQWTSLSAQDASAILGRLRGAAFPRNRAWQQVTPQEDFTLLVARCSGEPADLVKHTDIECAA